MTKLLRSTLAATILTAYASLGMAADIIGYGAPITNEQAKKAATAAIADAKKNNLAVVDSSGSLAYFEKIDGTQISSVETAIGKARTANNFKRPTKALEDVVSGGRVALLNHPMSSRSKVAYPSSLMAKSSAQSASAAPPPNKTNKPPPQAWPR